MLMVDDWEFIDFVVSEVSVSSVFERWKAFKD